MEHSSHRQEGICFISTTASTSHQSPVPPASADSRTFVTCVANSSPNTTTSSTFPANSNEPRSCLFPGTGSNQMPTMLAPTICPPYSGPSDGSHQFNPMSNRMMAPLQPPLPFQSSQHQTHSQLPLLSQQQCSTSNLFQPPTTTVPFTAPDSASNPAAIDFSSRNCTGPVPLYSAPKFEQSSSDNNLPQACDNLMIRMTKKLCNSQSLYNVCQKRNFAKHCGFRSNNDHDENKSTPDLSDKSSKQSCPFKARQSTSCKFLNKLLMSKNQGSCSSSVDKSHDTVPPPSPDPIMLDRVSESPESSQTSPAGQQSSSYGHASNFFQYFKQVCHQRGNNYSNLKGNIANQVNFQPEPTGSDIYQPLPTESGKSVLLDLLTGNSKGTSHDEPLFGKSLRQFPSYSSHSDIDKYRNSLPKSVSAYIENVIENSIHDGPPTKPCNFSNMIESIITNYFNLSRTASTSCPALSQLSGKHSALTNLLMDQSTSNSTTDELPHQSSSHDNNVCDISNKVYQKLIDFEFSHENIIKKFKSVCSSVERFECPQLNTIEKARIDELAKILYPLQFCLSSMSKKNAILKKSFHQCFCEKKTQVNVEFQQKVLLKMTESAINLLISLAKQIESFSKLESNDQTNLLRNNVMKIMIIRTLMVPNRKNEANINLKRCLETEMDEYSETEMKTPPPSPASTQPGMESDDESVDTVANEYSRKFRYSLKMLYRSLDEAWLDDNTIFYLIVAILLFRYKNCNPPIVDIEKVREEYLTYVYLLKRYLEHKFQSYCKARSHLVRLFDRMEELQSFNDQVVQKLLNYDVCYAQNLLQKLYIC